LCKDLLLHKSPPIAGNFEPGQIWVIDQHIHEDGMLESCRMLKLVITKEKQLPAFQFPGPAYGQLPLLLYLQREWLDNHDKPAGEMNSIVARKEIRLPDEVFDVWSIVLMSGTGFQRLML